MRPYSVLLRTSVLKSRIRVLVEGPHLELVIGLWHEIQNRLKNTRFDVVFHADSDSIFF